MEGISSTSAPCRRRLAGRRLHLGPPRPVRRGRISGCTTFATRRGRLPPSRLGTAHRMGKDGAAATRRVRVRGSEAAPPSRLRRVARGGAEGGRMSSSPPDPSRDDSSSEALVADGDVHGTPVRGQAAIVGVDNKCSFQIKEKNKDKDKDKEKEPPFLEEIRSQCDHACVEFELVLSEKNKNIAKQEGLEKKFKLATTIGTTNTCLTRMVKFENMTPHRMCTSP